MASNHHPHQPYHHQSHLPAACCCSCGFTSPCFQTHHPTPPPPPADSTLQAIASHILQSAQVQQCTHYPTIHSQKFQSHYQYQPHNRPKQKGLHQRKEVIHHSTISSLLSRIEALESRLQLVSADRPSYSLRDAAARTIQTHFRAFLVSRSGALRQLKELAVIKSRFNSLKSSLSLDTHIDLHAVALEAMDLLLDLDSVQGNDPMIRDSKRSICRDLVRLLEQIDDVTVRRNGLSLKAMKNLRSGQNVNKSRVSNTNHGSFGNQKETVEKLKRRVEKICELSKIYESDGRDLNVGRFHHVSDGNVGESQSPGVFINLKNQTQNPLLVKGHKTQPRVKKIVRFAENGDLSRILGDSKQHLSNGDDISDESDSGDELVENTCGEAMEIKEFSEAAEEEEEVQRDGGSPETSGGERNPRRKMISEDYYEVQVKNGGSAFSAPLPVKMENRADLMKNRKSLKILG